MPTKKIRVTSLVVFPALLLVYAGRAVADHVRDPKAEDVARAMVKAMGGEDAWKAAHFVRFDFKVKENGKLVENNAHLWDRKDGRYRIERMPKDGKREVILFSIGDYERDKSGSAYLDGKKLEGDAAKKSLEDAYASYINDMWWLAMPWKWFDPGVNLKYQGAKPCGKETCDEVELTFDHVGLTPGDTYHAFVSRKSHLMTHWDYILQSGDKGAWDWQYGDYHGVKLAKNHPSADHKMLIDMGDVRVLDAIDDGLFTDPAKMVAGLR